MKYSVYKVVNGNFSVHAECESADSAKINYFGLCQSLWNAPDVQTACAMILDDHLDMLPGYKEYINKTQPNA